MWTRLWACGEEGGRPKPSNFRPQLPSEDPAGTEDAFSESSLVVARNLEKERPGLGVLVPAKGRRSRRPALAGGSKGPRCSLVAAAFLKAKELGCQEGVSGQRN